MGLDNSLSWVSWAASLASAHKMSATLMPTRKDWRWTFPAWLRTTVSSGVLSLFVSSFTSGGVAEALMCNLGSLWETSGMQILTLPLLQDCDWGACFLRSLWDSEIFSFADKGCPILHKLTVGDSSLRQGQFNSFRVYSNPGVIWRLPRCDTLFPSPFPQVFLWSSLQVIMREHGSSTFSVLQTGRLLMSCPLISPFEFPSSFPRVLDQEQVMFGNFSPGPQCFPLPLLNLTALSCFYPRLFCFVFLGWWIVGQEEPMGLLLYSETVYSFTPPESTPFLPPHHHR